MPYTFLKGKNPGKIITDPRFIGFEIECDHHNWNEYDEESDEIDPESWADEHLPKNTCDVGGDGSLCTRNSIEVRVFPSSLDTLENNIFAITKVLREKGFTVDNCCGLHTHVDARDIKTNPTVINHIFKTVYAFENVLYVLSGPGRWDNHYCRNLRARYGYDELPEKDFDELFAKYSKELTKEEFINRGRRWSNKFEGFNVCSLFYKDTIEFRYHGGSLTPRVMLNWAALLQSIFTYAINGFDNDLIKSISMMETTDEQFKAMLKALPLTSSVQNHFKYQYRKMNVNRKTVPYRKGTHKEAQVEVAAPQPVPERYPMQVQEQVPQLGDVSVDSDGNQVGFNIYGSHNSPQ